MQIDLLQIIYITIICEDDFISLQHTEHVHKVVQPSLKVWLIKRRTGFEEHRDKVW